MTQLHSHLEIACRSIAAFADDGTLDAAELDKLVGLALRDGVIDADEHRVLERILREARAGRRAPDARAAIARGAQAPGLALEAGA